MARKTISKYKIDKVFIATEDADIEKEFVNEFGDIVILSEQVRPDYDGIHYISEMKTNRKNDAFLKGLEYLSTIMLLSKCDCFISGRNSGAVGVYLFSDNFEFDYIFDLGEY